MVKSYLFFLSHAKKHPFKRRLHISTCDQIASFDLGVKFYKPPRRDIFLSFLLRPQTQVLREDGPQHQTKKILYKNLESNLVHVGTVYNFDVVLHVIFQQTHIKITLYLNKPVVETGFDACMCILLCGPVTFRLEFFTDIKKLPFLKVFVSR